MVDLSPNMCVYSTYWQPTALSAQSAFTQEALLITPPPSTGIQVSIDLIPVPDSARARRLAQLLFGGHPSTVVEIMVGSSS